MPESVTLVDTHVHLRPSHDPAGVLDGAMRHFARMGDRLGAASCEGVLMLAEASGEHAFDRLASSDAPVGRWCTERCPDPLVVRWRRDDDGSLLLVNGRQIATKEGLEVLTLISSCEIPDGLGIRETLEEALGSGALVTLPWGFGKWTGLRRRLMLELVGQFGPRGIALGDSAGRPAGLGDGAIFALARRLGVAILPGTDPLPIPGHRERAGQYGLWFEGRLDANAPSADLRSRLSSSMSRDATIGRRDGFLRSIATQFRLRLG